jgi:hypothetical protein
VLPKFAEGRKAEVRKNLDTVPLYSRVPARLSRYDGVNHHFAELIAILSNATTAWKAHGAPTSNNGGPDNDFIDADNFESVGTPDLVNGGDGFDVCKVNENDAPVVNCERIETESDPTAASAAGAR